MAKKKEAEATIKMQMTIVPLEHFGLCSVRIDGIGSIKMGFEIGNAVEKIMKKYGKVTNEKNSKR